LTLQPQHGEARTITARTLVNAAGPWVAQVLGSVIHVTSTARVRLVQGSHIVVPKLYQHDRCYIFQNGDGRIFFAIPYENDYTLIGTTDQDYHGDPAEVHISEAEIAYLCAGASEYFRAPVTPGMVAWTYSGVRPLYDDGAGSAQAATRDYVLALDEAGPACLSVFGGKITTARRLAEAALAKLAGHLPPERLKTRGWTGREPLPGGDFACDGFDELVAGLRRDYGFLPPPTARRLARAYGTRARMILGEAIAMSDLGPLLGADLTTAELRYLMEHEWVATAEDALWRRSKLGLRFTPEQVAAVAREIENGR
jgi:glycerol-3-phosphate dehydrogenase